MQVAKEASPPPDPAPPKPDPIAEKIKQKDEPKQETKVDQPLPPKKPPPPKPQPKFDADKIAALLDKRDPTAQCGDRHGTQHGGFAGRARRHGSPAVAV